MSKKNWVFLILAASLSVLFFNLSPFLDRVVRYNKNDQTADVLQVKNKPTAPVIKPLDTIAYDKKLNEILENILKLLTILRIKSVKISRICIIQLTNMNDILSKR